MTLAPWLFFYGPYQFIVIIYALFHSLRNKEFRKTLMERIFLEGDSLRRDSNPIWIHSASVGEVRGIAPFIELIRDKNSDLDLIFTTTSSTGLVESKKLYPEKFSSLLALDLSFLIASFIRKTKPRLLIINETEIWPQLFIQASRFSVPVLLVNGRISDKTFPNYLRFKFLFSSLLDKVDLIGVQTELDKHRFIRIGANEEKVSVLGNTKFDTGFENVDSELHEMLKVFRASSDTCVSFGSIREEEEGTVLEALKRILKSDKNYSLLIAPRHPKRFTPFYDELVKLGFPVYVRSNTTLSDLKTYSSGSKIFFLDTLGEMLAIYKESDLAFVGGTYSSVGGHNILEPAYFGIPIVIGPRIETQRQAFETLKKFKAIKVVDQPSDLGNIVLELLEDKKSLEIQGKCAYNAFLELQGASNRLYSSLVKYL